VNRSIYILSIIVVVLLVACTAEETAVLPSEAKQHIDEEYRTVMTGRESQQERMEKHGEIAETWLSKTIQEDISREEQLILADIMLTAGQTEPGRELIRELSEGDDLVARQAWVSRLMEIFFEGKDDEFRLAVDEYHQRFQPTAEDISGIYRPLQFAVVYHIEQGDPDVARSLAETHFAWLNGEAPYRAWKLLIDVKPIYEQQDELVAWEALRDQALLDLQAGHAHDGTGVSGLEQEYHDLVQMLQTGRPIGRSAHSGMRSPHW